MTRHTLPHFQGKTEMTVESTLGSSGGNTPKSMTIVTSFNGEFILHNQQFRVTKGLKGFPGVRYFWFHSYNEAVDKYNSLP
jgi:hypothetical protein